MGGGLPAARSPDDHAWHLYPLRLSLDRIAIDRARFIEELRLRGVGASVHFIPLHLHPFYRERFGIGPGLCPVAEAAYERLLTLPMFPAMGREEVEDVVAALTKVLRHYER